MIKQKKLNKMLKEQDKYLQILIKKIEVEMKVPKNNFRLLWENLMMLITSLDNLLKEPLFIQN